QQNGIDQRQAPGTDHTIRCGKEPRVWVVQQRPGVFEARPEHVTDALVALSGKPGPDPVADIEQRPEESCEEHHLGKDEPGHAPTERAVHLRTVEPRAAFPHYGTKPAEHHRSEEHTSELQSRENLVCRLLL